MSSLSIVLFTLVASCSAVRLLQQGNRSVSQGNRSVSTPNVTSVDETMSFMPRQFVEVKLGPFESAEEACDYCFGSFTKKGDPPAGPVAPFCVCMAYSGSNGWNMFCSTPPSAAGYVGKKNGCRCKARDMAAQGRTT